MIKTITFADLRRDGVNFLKAYEESKKEIELPVKSLYSLLKIKKTFETELERMNDLITLIANKYGAEVKPDGSFQIPQDKVEEADKELKELSMTEIDLDYIPIIVADDSNIPADIFECILDFVDIE